MRSRATLFLMELLVMILVFSLAAAICLEGFSAALSMTEDTARQDAAVILARSAAEAMKAARGGREEALELLGDAGNQDLCLEITPLDSDIPGLGQALVTVSEEGEILISLTAAWQEEAE